MIHFHHLLSSSTLYKAWNGMSLPWTKIKKKQFVRNLTQALLGACVRFGFRKSAADFHVNGQRIYKRIFYHTASDYKGKCPCLVIICYFCARQGLTFWSLQTNYVLLFTKTPLLYPQICSSCFRMSYSCVYFFCLISDWLIWYRRSRSKII